MIWINIRQQRWISKRLWCRRKYENSNTCVIFSCWSCPVSVKLFIKAVFSGFWTNQCKNNTGGSTGDDEGMAIQCFKYQHTVIGITVNDKDDHLTLKAKLTCVRSVNKGCNNRRFGKNWIIFSANLLESQMETTFGYISLTLEEWNTLHCVTFLSVRVVLEPLFCRSENSCGYFTLCCCQSASHWLEAGKT